MDLFANVCPPFFYPYSRVKETDSTVDIVGWAISMSLAVVFLGLWCLGRVKQRCNYPCPNLLAVSALVSGYVFSRRTHSDDMEASIRKAKHDYEALHKSKPTQFQK